MILIDANLLIYASDSSVFQHERSRSWLDEQLSGTAPVGLPWQSLLAYLRITTNPRSISRPQKMSDAWIQVREWLACEPAWTPEPTQHHSKTMHELCESANVFGEHVPDAYLAALALDHGLTLCSNDSDFARFPSLRWFNPLAA
jgi:toxin-antitoxin system PIN domain toxin